MLDCFSENAMDKKAAEDSPWGALEKLREWDPKGVDLLLRTGTNPWNSGVLPPKEIELLCLALCASITSLHEAGTRRHIRRALDAGATRDEIVLLFKCAAIPALHSMSLGAPVLVEEMKTAGVKATGGPKPDTPSCDALRAMGQWNTAFDPFLELAPGWTEDYFAFAAGSIYQSGIFTPRFIELISIAVDASVTHMYVPGVRRHIKGALKAGATPEEIVTVLQLCVSMGMQACTQGIAILAEELERR
jgi:alkylhydroperoxidase/carboxymuconolactone decarboxylase family protein YurZ